MNPNQNLRKIKCTFPDGEEFDPAHYGYTAEEVFGLIVGRMEPKGTILSVTVSRDLMERNRRNRA